MAYAAIVFAAVLILAGIALVVHAVAWGLTKLLVEPASQPED